MWAWGPDSLIECWLRTRQRPNPSTSASSIHKGNEHFLPCKLCSPLDVWLLPIFLPLFDTILPLFSACSRDVLSNFNKPRAWLPLDRCTFCCFSAWNLLLLTVTGLSHLSSRISFPLRRLLYLERSPLISLQQVVLVAGLYSCASQTFGAHWSLGDVKMQVLTQ